MATDNIIEYLPAGEPSTDRNWNSIIMLNVILVVCWWGLTHAKGDHGAGGWFFLAGILILLDISIIRKEMDPIKLTINTQTGDFIYDYANFFGKEKTANITIKTAYIDYDFTSGNTGALKRLLIYNNYFKNRVTIRQNSVSGFTREQLDDIFEKLMAVQSK